MNKLARILSTGVVGASLLTGVASADITSCEIKNTGSDSVNSCKTVYETKAVCDTTNHVYVLNENDQKAGSGKVSVKGDTTVGDVASGDAVNENGALVKLNVTGCGGQVASVTPTTNAPAATVSPVAGGRGGGGAAPSASAPAVSAAASLPETGSNTAATVATVSAVALAAAAAVSQFGIRAYRRLALK